MFLNGPASMKQRGSALLIALFVIVVMGLLAATMGRFLVDSGEKYTVEVRGLRALMVAQSGVDIALYRLYPKRTLIQPSPVPACGSSTLTFDSSAPGLVGCQVAISCVPVSTVYQGATTTGYRITSIGTCGLSNLTGPNPDFAVSRTLVAEAYNGTTP
jgi:MSHA biogenesis protein MshP